MKKVKSRKGFTLIELLVTVAILSIVCGMGVGIFASVMRNYGTASSLENEQEKATQIEEQIIRSVRAAKQVCFIQKGASDAPEDSNGIETKKVIPTDKGSYIFSKGGSSDVEVYDYTVPEGGTDAQKTSIISVSGVKKLTFELQRQKMEAADATTCSDTTFMYLNYTIEMLNGYTLKGSLVINSLVDDGNNSGSTYVDNVKPSFDVCDYQEISGVPVSDRAILFVY